MKVKHRNISTTYPTNLLSADLNRLYVRTIHSLLISNTYTATSTVTVYIQSVNAAKSKRELNRTAEGDSFQKFNNAFFIIKNLQLPKQASIDLVAEFPKGLLYNSNYELVIRLETQLSEVSKILAYE